MNSYKLTRIPMILIVAVSISQTTFATPNLDLADLPPNFCPDTSMPLAPDSNQIIRVANVSDGTNIYQAGFDRSNWSGHLFKFPLVSNQDQSITARNFPVWDAAKILTDSTIPAKRTILTYNPVTHSTIPFQYSELPGEIKQYYDRSFYSGATDGLGVQRISYIYGDRQMEKQYDQSNQSNFRKRDFILGDIVGSTPVYVGALIETTSEPNYQSFYEQFKNRAGAIYVGANDGMLHSFSAATGEELFAYIPSPLLNKLPKLTDPAYKHETFMDGKVKVDNAQLSGTWKTVLTAGMGSGAKGIFALDVSSPDAVNSSQRVIFEFTEKDDPDIGFVLSAPSIMKIRNGKSIDTVDNNKYFIAVPSGYNSANPKGESFLFLLSMDKPAKSLWALNKNYYKLKISATNAALANGLSSPGLALNLQGFVDFAYSGDLQGNIWRFDFSKGENPSDINPIKLFTAVDSENKPQSITATPVVSYAPGGGYLISFGTGKYLEYSDNSPPNFRLNTFYTIRDTKSLKQGDYYIKGRSELAERTLTQSTLNGKNGFKVLGPDFFFGDAQSMRSKKGWFLDFINSNITGERIISSPLIAFGNVFFNTLIPGRRCGEALASQSYEFGVLNGKLIDPGSLTGQKSLNAAVGMPLLILGKTELGNSNPIGQRTTTQFYSLFNFGSGDTSGSALSSESRKSEIRTGRLSWREIPSWQDRH